jgi:ribosome-associated translation inhibitor RaiA
VAQVLPFKATTMHIDIVGDESIDRQTRIYAEYRLFAALAPSTDLKQFSRAQLVLRRARGPQDGKQTECVVDVELNDGAVARFSAAGGHPYQAVNRAIERVRRAASSMNAVG